MLLLFKNPGFDENKTRFVPCNIFVYILIWKVANVLSSESWLNFFFLPRDHNKGFP